MLTYLFLAALAGMTVGAPQNAGLSALIKKTFPKETNKANQPPIGDQDFDKLVQDVFQLPNKNPGTSVLNQPIDNGGLGHPNGDNTGGNSNSDNCECVPYYQCQNQTIVDDGVGIIDIR